MRPIKIPSKEYVKKRYFDFRLGGVTINPIIQISNFTMLLFIVVNEILPFWLFVPLFLMSIGVVFVTFGNKFRHIQQSTDLELIYEKNIHQVKAHLLTLRALNKMQPDPEIEDQIRYLERISRHNGKMTVKEVKHFYSKGEGKKIFGKDKIKMHLKFRDYLCTLNINSAFEFGCNAGYNLVPLKNKNIKIFGIDINQKAIKYGIKKNHLMLSYGTEDELKVYSKNSFDLVFTSSVLDHIPDEKFDSIIKDLTRIAKKYVICYETNDDINSRYYSHNYEKYGFKIRWQMFSPSNEGGNNCLYSCYQKSV